jgi:hypothetical protein
MATNGDSEAFAPADVLAAVRTMKSSEQESKTKANEYLSRFQKSVRGCPIMPFLGCDDVDANRAL